MSLLVVMMPCDHANLMISVSQMSETTGGRCLCDDANMHGKKRKEDSHLFNLCLSFMHKLFASFFLVVPLLSLSLSLHCCVASHSLAPFSPFGRWIFVAKAGGSAS